MTRKLLGFDFTGAMGVLNKPALSFDELPTMSDALFRRVHLFANGFLAHDSTRWRSLSKQRRKRLAVPVRHSGRNAGCYVLSRHNDRSRRAATLIRRVHTRASRTIVNDIKYEKIFWIFP